MPYFSIFSPLCLAIVSKSSLMEMSCGNFKYISPVEWLILDLVKEVSTMYFWICRQKKVISCFWPKIYIYIFGIFDLLLQTAFSISYQIIFVFSTYRLYSIYWNESRRVVSDWIVVFTSPITCLDFSSNFDDRFELWKLFPMAFDSQNINVKLMDVEVRPTTFKTITGM